MTGPADFLARWSRRKRAEKARAPAPPADAPSKTAPSTTDAIPAADDEPVIDLASLPSLESIGAGADIRAFLQRGVPLDLTRAALRRAWETDPAIRHYKGLAELDWDFHTPGALPGFGPMQPGDDVAKMLADVIGELDEAAAESVAVGASESDSQENDTIADNGLETPSAAESAQLPAVKESPPDAAEQHYQVPVKEPDKTAKRRHGGALPT